MYELVIITKNEGEIKLIFDKKSANLPLIEMLSDNPEYIFLKGVGKNFVYIKRDEIKIMYMNRNESK